MTDGQFWLALLVGLLAASTLVTALVGMSAPSETRAVCCAQTETIPRA
jgi:hypothetical protein